MHRKLKGGEKPWPIILQDELALVQVCDGFGERKTEPRSFRRSARIEPAEALPSLCQTVCRNTGSAIPHLDPYLAIARRDVNGDLAAFGAVSNGILDQVADGLREQLAVPE